VGIDFHDAANQLTYSGRTADPSWAQAVTQLVEPTSAAVVDIGCGGGTYTRAWSALGAASVVGVDFSAPILAAARASHRELSGGRFRRGDAARSGLPAGTADIVFERALIHHTPDLPAVAEEARRLLRPGGVLVIQDRTPDDVARPGSPTHPRGWFFDVFPHLLHIENARRPTCERVTEVLGAAGFADISTSSLWEVRRQDADREEYLAEIAQRTGRSILHHLTDPQLDHLVAELRHRLPEGPFLEQDRWTLWRAAQKVGPAAGGDE
jgi:SAM-dependent methyltransferase